jgi:predicted transcriptional regulator
MATTSVKIEHDLEKPLRNFMKQTHRPKGWVINTALREYLTHIQTQKERWEDTLEALEDIRLGRVIDGNKVHAWLDSWGTGKELSPPEK